MGVIKSTDLHKVLNDTKQSKKPAQTEYLLNKDKAKIQKLYVE